MSIASTPPCPEAVAEYAPWSNSSGSVGSKTSAGLPRFTMSTQLSSKHPTSATEANSSLSSPP
eukprot:9545733-Alexandrium_andersonii.AAC.1